MKTLHLNLKRKWFDMILSGEKKEEYREIKPHYISRLVNYSTIEFKEYSTVTFSNGYSKTRDQFVIELKKIWIKKGKEKWGAEKDKVYFVLELGDILKNIVK